MSDSPVLTSWTLEEEEAFQQMEAKRKAADQALYLRETVTLLRNLATHLEDPVNKHKTSVEVSVRDDEHSPHHYKDLPSFKVIEVKIPYSDAVALEEQSQARGG